MATPLQADDLLPWWKDRSRPKLIEFYANWCIYHLLTKKRIASLQEKLSQQLDEAVELVEFDVVGHEPLAQSLGIKNVPTMVFLHGSQVLMWAGDTDVEVMLAQIESPLPRGAR